MNKKAQEQSKSVDLKDSKRMVNSVGSIQEHRVAAQVVKKSPLNKISLSEAIWNPSTSSLEDYSLEPSTNLGTKKANDSLLLSTRSKDRAESSSQCDQSTSNIDSTLLARQSRAHSNRESSSNYIGDDKESSNGDDGNNSNDDDSDDGDDSNKGYDGDKTLSTKQQVADPMDPKNYSIIVDGIEKYKCVRCSTVFNQKRYLNNHLLSTKTCSSRVRLQQLMKKRVILTNHEKSNQHLIYGEIITSSQLPPDIKRLKELNDLTEKSSSTKAKGSKIIINNNQQIINNNISNNNKIEPKIQIELRDFCKEDFEYVHIKNNAVFDESFFEHKTFLTHVLSNDVNKNIYFKDNYAYIFTNNTIIRAPIDKAGYYLMDKLHTTLGSFLRSNSLIKLEDYNKKIKFYSVEKFKYLNDTIYKSYDHKTDTYVSNVIDMLWTRDKYLTDMAETFDKMVGDIKDTIDSQVPDCNPDLNSKYTLNIPNFVPKRLRNKAFNDE